jgi:hypothetical protein
MLTNKLKIPLTYKGKYGFWRLLNLAVLGLLSFGTMFTCYFIYQNIYSAIANANAIVSLKSNMHIYVLDLPAYEKAEVAIKQKRHLEEIPIDIRNIFYYSSSTYANNNAKH